MEARALETEEELSAAFPGLRVLPLRMCDLKIRQTDPKLDAFRKEVEQKVKQGVKSLEEIRDLPVLRAYRDFFWRVGIDPTKTRPAGEALVRRVISGRDLPRINTLVDAYNVASLETSVAIAAFDLGKISEGDLLMRKARPAESFLGIGMESPMTLHGVEVVIEDKKSGRLIAVYPYRDSEDSKVTLDTRHGLLLMCGVPGIETEVLMRAREVAERYVSMFCKF
ncbi:MAG: B3/B4 domain-containing protein [Nitrososphaerales archaeon]